MIPTIIDLQQRLTNPLKVDTDTSQSLLSKQRARVFVLLFYLTLTFAGKVEKENVYKPKNHVPSKIERRNTQKQIQKNKKDEQVRNARFFGGARGAAKIVVCTLSLIAVEM